MYSATRVYQSISQLVVYIYICTFIYKHEDGGFVFARANIDERLSGCSPAETLVDCDVFSLSLCFSLAKNVVFARQREVRTVTDVFLALLTHADVGVFSYRKKNRRKSIRGDWAKSVGTL